MKHQAYLIALASIILLSSNASAIAFGSQYADPIVLLFFSSIIICLFTFQKALSFAKQNKSLLKSKNFIILILLKIINDLTFFFALGTTKAIDATIIIYLYPVSNIIVSSLILDKKYDRLNIKSWILVCTAFASIALLSPFSIFSELSLPVFLICVISAGASAYLVYIQKISDDLSLENKSTEGLIPFLYIFNLLSSIVYILFNPLIISDFTNLKLQEITIFLSIAAWIGLAANYYSEVLWIKAARMYKDISLKSMFYLSPVLGALYLSLLGFDEINSLIVFSLTGVLISNFLIHQSRVDDLSFIIFIFGLVIFTTIISQFNETIDLSRISLTGSLLDIHIATVSIILGFLIFRAFEVYSKANNSFMKIIEKTAVQASKSNDNLLNIEIGFNKLIEKPDIADWTDSERRESSSFLKLLYETNTKNEYLNFFRLRFLNTSYIELFFTFIISLSVIPVILFHTILSENVPFLAVFLASVFLFIPFFIIDLITLRTLRPYIGIFLRRALWLEKLRGEDEYPKTTKQFGLANTNRLQVMIILSIAMSTASWLLLYTTTQQP